jgi:hypothetical protein
MARRLLALELKSVSKPGPAVLLLEEAQQGFETIARKRAVREAERMASVCLAERGDCLAELGQLDEAANAYEENIQRAETLGDERQIAVGKGQLSTIRLRERRYREALAGYDEVLKRFSGLGEPGTVAALWHQTGMAYQEVGQPEAAEDAYLKALAIAVRLGDGAKEAATLTQMGVLYDDVLGLPEEAVVFFRQAAGKCFEGKDTAHEGLVRSNLAATLRRLPRLDEARREVRRAIECKAPLGHAAEPWKTWDILADIETDAGNSDAAARAKERAVAAYLAYRRNGGENHSGPGRLALAVSRSLLAGDPDAAASLLQQLAADPELPDWHRLAALGRVGLDGVDGPQRHGGTRLEAPGRPQTDRRAADLEGGDPGLAPAAPGNGQVAGARQGAGGQVVPQGLLLVLVVDAALGRAVGADQQVGPSGCPAASRNSS